MDIFCFAELRKNLKIYSEMGHRNRVFLKNKIEDNEIASFSAKNWHENICKNNFFNAFIN